MWSTSAAGQDPYFAEYISRSATLVHTGAVPSETDPSELRLGEVLDLVAGLVALGLITLIVADRSGLPRTLLALGFAFFVPGRAIVSNWPRMAAWSEAAMPMVLSLGVLALVAAAALWAHEWHPVGLFEVEALLSLVGLAVGIVRRRRSRTDAADRQPPSWPQESAPRETM